jgi:hypothetical protein
MSGADKPFISVTVAIAGHDKLFFTIYRRGDGAYITDAPERWKQRADKIADAIRFTREWPQRPAPVWAVE